MKMDWPRFAKAVHKARKRQKQTVRAVADKLDLTPATVWRADVGKPVETEAFLLLCHYFLLNPIAFLR